MDMLGGREGGCGVSIPVIVIPVLWSDFLTETNRFEASEKLLKFSKIPERQLDGSLTRTGKKFNWISNNFRLLRLGSFETEPYNTELMLICMDASGTHRVVFVELFYMFTVSNCLYLCFQVWI